jgi:hypothetical protein
MSFLEQFPQQGHATAGTFDENRLHVFESQSPCAFTKLVPNGANRRKQHLQPAAARLSLGGLFAGPGNNLASSVAGPRYPQKDTDAEKSGGVSQQILRSADGTMDDGLTRPWKSDGNQNTRDGDRSSIGDDISQLQQLAMIDVVGNSAVTQQNTDHVDIPLPPVG